MTAPRALLSRLIIRMSPSHCAFIPAWKFSARASSRLFLYLFHLLQIACLKLRFLKLHKLFNAGITYEVFHYVIILSSSHILRSCFHKNVVGRNVIFSRHIYDLRSNNNGLFTLEVGKTQSLTFSAVTPKNGLRILLSTVK
jgi:hypothetical protein